MSEDKKPLGSSIVDRLVNRSKRPELERETVGGGGEVFRGPLASRALKALGARAMTVDNAIIVGDDFDYSKPESQALYAHEQFHKDVSGGRGSHHGHDSEEMAARAVERMVLHRAAGGYESGGSVAGGKLQSSQDPESDGSPDNADASDGQAASVPGASKAERGYDVLQSQGMSHQDIVDKLAESCLEQIERQDEERLARSGDLKGSY